MPRITIHLDDATQALAGRFADFPRRDAADSDETDLLCKISVASEDDAPKLTQADFDRCPTARRRPGGHAR